MLQTRKVKMAIFACCDNKVGRQAGWHKRKVMKPTLLL